MHCARMYLYNTMKRFDIVDKVEYPEYPEYNDTEL